jgi:hypothetical protein
MIILSNSCSFGAPDQNHKIYPQFISDIAGSSLINEGVPGSCNRRIVRSTLRTLIDLVKTDEDILVLVGLTFISRTELWQPWLEPDKTDGDFHSISSKKIMSLDWSKGLNNTFHSNVACNADDEVKDYYKQWLIHYSKEAAVTELLTDIIMLTNFAKNNGINILIFENCQKLPTLPHVDVASPFLSNFFKYINDSKNVINLWDFSFRDFSLNAGYKPKDAHKLGNDGHPSEEAHEHFANHIIEYIRSHDICTLNR